MDKYKINEQTLAIIPINNTKTKIYEDNNVIIVNKSAKKIVEENCLYYGSSYEGRRHSTEDLIGITYKSPIIIEETNNIIFFPTCSPRLKTCGWISLNNLDNFVPYNDESQIFFRNNLSLNINVSTSVIENQILKASRLDSVVRSRKKKNSNNTKKTAKNI